MTCPAMMLLSIIAVHVLLHSQADAVEVDLGTRFPAMPNEEIVVRNDGGVRNETHSFAFGKTCHSDPDLKTWFIVRQIVGEHVLVKLECLRTVFGDSCPNGTETSKPVAETRARVNAYARETVRSSWSNCGISGRSGRVGRIRADDRPHDAFSARPFHRERSRHRVAQVQGAAGG